MTRVCGGNYLAGTVGPLEVVVWAYAHGRPVDRVEQGTPGQFAALTTEELKRRQLTADAALPQG